MTRRSPKPKSPRTWRIASVYVGRFAGPGEPEYPLGAAIVTADRRRLNPRTDLRRHSTAFQWGYEGSGPAQLALAILCHFLRDDEAAQRIYQEFKREVVARWKQGEPWGISGHEIAKVPCVAGLLVSEVMEA